MMDNSAREGPCDSVVAKEAPEKTPRIGPKSRRAVCDPTAFAFEAFSPPLPPRPVDEAKARAPRVRAHRRFVESVPVADLQ